MRLFDKKQYDEAQVIFEQVLKSEPENAAALSGLCSIKIDKGDFSAAEKILSSMNKKIKSSKVYWKWRGQIEAGNGKFAEAKAAYDKALEIDPKYSQVYNLLLQTFEKKEEYTAACEYLFKAIFFIIHFHPVIMLL